MGAMNKALHGGVAMEMQSFPIQKPRFLNLPDLSRAEIGSEMQHRSSFQH